MTLTRPHPDPGSTPCHAATEIRLGLPLSGLLERWDGGTGPGSDASPPGSRRDPGDVKEEEIR